MSTVTVEPSAAPVVVEPTGAARPVERVEAPAVVRPDRRHLWVLLAITVLGVVLRFSFPNRPPLWGDDAYTVYRTHADYQAMLDVLQNDGFTPLHYELYWLLGRIAGTEKSPLSEGGRAVEHSTGLTPAVVRFLPALWGSLMPPVIYFLAVQLVRRRIALGAALMAACSAYLLGYSRDGKMYMMLWMFSALSTACLLWWLRTGLRVAWLSWVAASLAMASSHMPGVAMLPFQAVFFLTRSRVHWKEAIGFVIGVAIAAAGPAAYITQFNTWAKEQVKDFGFEVEGLSWVVLYNEGRDGPDLLRYATSAYLLSWEWPKRRDEADIKPWVLTTLKAATWVLLFLAVIGAMPWSRRLRGIREGDPNDVPPQPWWRVLLWLGLWLIIPVYFMYCRSVTNFTSPGDWWNELGKALGGPAWRKEGGTSAWFWVLLFAAMTALGVGVFLSRRIRLLMVWVVPAAAGIALIVSLLRAGAPATAGRTGDMAWVQYVFRPLIEWANSLTAPWVLTGLAVVLPGLVVYYCGTNWVDRVRRVAQFAAVAGAILLACHLAYKAADAKLNKEVDQYIKRSYPQPKGNSPRDEQLRADWERRLADPAVRASVKEQLEAPNAPWQSIFMPRYVGFVWVPLCIGLCAAYMRLPTRAFQVTAIALFVGVNLLQFRARLFAGCEPPMDLIARDVWQQDSKNKNADPALRTYVTDSPMAGQSGHPGYGGLSNQMGKYYFGLMRRYWFHPTQWRGARTDEHFDIRPGVRSQVSPALVAADVGRNPQVRRVVVWEAISRRSRASDSDDGDDDRTLRALGPGWARVNQTLHPVRLHWNWSDLYTYRRSEYAKAS